MHPDSQKQQQSLGARRHHQLTLDIIRVLNAPHCSYVLNKELTYKHLKDSMINVNY